MNADPRAFPDFTAALESLLEARSRWPWPRNTPRHRSDGLIPACRRRRFLGQTSGIQDQRVAQPLFHQGRVNACLAEQPAGLLSDGRFTRASSRHGLASQNTSAEQAPPALALDLRGAGPRPRDHRGPGQVFARWADQAGEELGLYGKAAPILRTLRDDHRSSLLHALTWCPLEGNRRDVWKMRMDSMKLHKRTKDITHAHTSLQEDGNLLPQLSVHGDFRNGWSTDPIFKISLLPSPRRCVRDRGEIRPTALDRSCSAAQHGGFGEPARILHSPRVAQIT
ncbi:hypothetical protein Q5P01_001028 [Channa striata]|uniref:Uncharacterized protein n=1 Tax=Channa striata TaxID=64152 RepID=A0AA88IXP1_CHASR|nr:hypothetical protein Q5P01_001028 [Channa striata]